MSRLPKQENPLFVSIVVSGIVMAAIGYVFFGYFVVKALFFFMEK